MTVSQSLASSPMIIRPMAYNTVYRQLPCNRSYLIFYLFVPGSALYSQGSYGMDCLSARRISSPNVPLHPSAGSRHTAFFLTYCLRQFKCH